MKRAELAALLLVLAVIAVALRLAVVPGVFTIDEDNYLASILALRQGSFSLLDTAGLPPSRELIFFDPAMAQAVVAATPVTPAVPPLYAFLAFPFSLMGWSGLFSLSILSFLAGGALVFFYVRHLDADVMAPWLALAAYMLCGYLVEYSLGVWPHTLAASLCFGAVYLAMRVRTGGSSWLALFAGLLVGLATGVRYQNLVFGAAVGLGLLLWGDRRWRSSLFYAAGFSLPLLASAWINFVRLGVFNPVTKGHGYLALPLVSGHSRAAGPWLDGFLSLGTRVVDFSWLPFTEMWAHMGFQHDARTGAFIGVTAVRKALLQSAPWVALSLAGLAGAWWRGQPASDSRVRVELRALSLPVVAVFALFFAGGTGRHSGAVSNSRYLIELLPVAAATLPLVLPEALALKQLALGAGLGAGLAGLALTGDPMGWPRHLALLKAPLLLAAGIVALLLVARRTGKARWAFSAVLGACLAWAAVVHLGDDLPASRRVREGNLSQARFADWILPATPAALLAAHPAAFGPLKMRRDVVLLSLGADHGADALRMVNALLAQGRRVFFFLPFTPNETRRRILASHGAKTAGPPGSPFLEIGPLPTR